MTGSCAALLDCLFDDAPDRTIAMVAEAARMPHAPHLRAQWEAVEHNRAGLRHQALGLCNRGLKVGEAVPRLAGRRGAVRTHGCRLP